MGTMPEHKCLSPEAAPGGQSNADASPGKPSDQPAYDDLLKEVTERSISEAYALEKNYTSIQAHSFGYQVLEARWELCSYNRIRLQVYELHGR